MTFTYAMVGDSSRSRDTEKLRARVERGLTYLGPWCPRCGKKGQTCKRREGCDARRMARALQGLDSKRLEGVALPNPPHDWIVEKGYGTETAAYYSGGRWKNGTIARLTMRHGVDRVAMRQHYAYDLAMGWRGDA